MRKIDEIRNDIDKIDQTLQDFFVKRLDLVQEIIEYKKANQLAIYDEKRERELILKNLKRLSNTKYEKYYLDYLKNILSISKSFQEEYYE